MDGVRVGSLARRRSGQALLETALTLPLLMLIVLNAINLGYFFWAAINLVGATRAGAQWSIMGTGSTLGAQLPPSGDQNTPTSVAYLTFQDMSAFASPSSNALVVVCTTTYTNGFGSYSCNNPYGNGSLSVTPDVDPEAPTLTLNRVDVVYQFTPLIGKGWIGVWSPPLKIHR
jgi:Flp pilus assembly protein TadG